MPWDAPDRIQRLNGVDAAGTVSALDVGDDLVRSVAGLDGQTERSRPAGDGGLGRAVRRGPRGAATGRFFDTGHDQRADKVVVLGKHAAERLGINRVDSQPAVFIGDEPYTVIGILDSVTGRAELNDAVIMPNGAAKTAYDLESPDAVEIRTQVGAAQLIAGQAPIAISRTTRARWPSTLRRSRAPYARVSSPT